MAMNMDTFDTKASGTYSVTPQKYEAHTTTAAVIGNLLRTASGKVVPIASGSTQTRSAVCSP